VNKYASHNTPPVNMDHVILQNF